MASELEPIPIADAKCIATDYGYHQVVIIARKVGDNGGEHVTTYGVDKANCSVAARIGDFLKYKVMGWVKDNERTPAPADRGLVWSTDFENAPHEGQDGASVLLTVRNRNTGVVFAGEAYYDPREESEGWRWANTGPGDYYAEPVTQVCDVLAWCPMPEPPSAALTDAKWSEADGK